MKLPHNIVVAAGMIGASNFIELSVAVANNTKDGLKQIVMENKQFIDDNVNNTEIHTLGKPKVAFVCLHNSCRSQIAEAVAKIIAKDEFESFSAGTELKSSINPDAVRLIKDKYGVDMTKTQYNKLLKDIPNPDILITMGCNVVCPVVPNKYSEDWGLEDPTDKSDEDFLIVINKIEEKIISLVDRLNKITNN